MCESSQVNEERKEVTNTKAEGRPQRGKLAGRGAVVDEQNLVRNVARRGE